MCIYLAHLFFYANETITSRCKEHDNLLFLGLRTKSNLMENLKLKQQEPQYYLFFDTETTGLPQNWDAPLTDGENWPRLVQLAYLLYDNKEHLIHQQNFIVKPIGFEIPQSASNIHRISTEKALKNGKDLQWVLKQFEQILDKADCIVGHNIPFDINIIGAELIRCKRTENSLIRKLRICTMVSSTNYCQLPKGEGYKWPTLTELHCKLFGKGFNNSHDAYEDVQATANCFWKLKQLGIIKPPAKGL